MCYTVRTSMAASSHARAGGVSPQNAPDSGLGKLPLSPLRRSAAFENRSTLRVEHLLDYRYPDEAQSIATRLCLTPPDVHGAQRLIAHRFQFAPLPHSEPEHVDRFGNRIVEIRHERARAHLTIVAVIETENSCRYDADGLAVPTPIPPGDEALPELWCVPTHLTEPGETLAALANQLQQELPADADAFDIAFAFSRYVYRTMRYTPGSTTIDTTAVQAWEGKQGVCQDYAHIVIALCRSVGICARYVSGFLRGEGAMHAWVEALLPPLPGQGLPENVTQAWYAIDPTHDCWVNEQYVTIAVGRDYTDVTPSSGTFYGRVPGVLAHHSRVVVKPPVIVAL